MTNTLHRRGTRENLANDFVVFISPAAGVNKEGSAPKIKEFLRICLAQAPVNMGNGVDKPLPAAQWPKLIDGVSDAWAAAATFDDPAKVAAVLKALVAADLGLSINLSGLADAVDGLCRHAGIVRHSIEHSLGIWGARNRLPADPYLEIHTMCGHGMVSHNLIKKMVDLVKTGKLTPAQAAAHLAKPCSCGAFNPTRARLLIEKMRELG